MKYSLLILLGFLLTACLPQNTSTESVDNILENPHNAGGMLYFSIDSDDNIEGKIRLSALQPNSDENNIILPFQTKGNKNSINLLSSSGNYEDFTIINYKLAMKSFSSPTEIGFIPILGEPESENISYDDLPKGIYLLKTGLERKFIYQNKIALDIQKKFDNVIFKPIDWVAVNLPKESRGIELKGGKTTSPDAKYVSGSTKFFSYGENRGEKIILSYILPPNKKLTLFAEVLIKFFAFAASPFIEFVLLPSNANLSADRKRNILRLLLAIQILMVLALLYLSFFTSAITTEKISDLIFVVLGAIVAFVMGKFKP